MATVEGSIAEESHSSIESRQRAALRTFDKAEYRRHLKRCNDVFEDLLSNLQEARAAHNIRETQLWQLIQREHEIRWSCPKVEDIGIVAWCVRRSVAYTPRILREFIPAPELCKQEQERRERLLTQCAEIARQLDQQWGRELERVDPPAVAERSCGTIGHPSPQGIEELQTREEGIASPPPATRPPTAQEASRSGGEAAPAAAGGEPASQERSWRELGSRAWGAVRALENWCYPSSTPVHDKRTQAKQAEALENLEALTQEIQNFLDSLRTVGANGQETEKILATWRATYKWECVEQISQRCTELEEEFQYLRHLILHIQKNESESARLQIARCETCIRQCRLMDQWLRENMNVLPLPDMVLIDFSRLLASASRDAKIDL